MRPKIGRPPAAEILPPAHPAPVEILPAPIIEAPELPATSRWDARLVVFSVCLVLAMTLVLSRAIAPPLNQAPPAIPPLAETAPPLAEVPAPLLVGTLATIGPDEPSVSYIAKERNPPIDNAGRERLLSILSKD